MTGTNDIFAIITQGELSALQQLVNADPALAGARGANGVSALMTALYYRKTEMAEYLRARIPALDLFEAAALGDTERIGALLREQQPVNHRSADGFTPLHLAAFFDQPGCIKILLECGADVNAVAGNPSRVQPLHSAVACRSAECVRLLLEHGAAVNGRQQGGWTALQAAAKHGSMEMVELLLQYGADPGQAADDGQTALSLAVDDSIRQRLAKK